MLPLAVKHGAGAEIYNGLAMAVVGGLSVATLFTLVFIPVIYTILEDVKSQVLESSAYHVGRYKRRHSAQRRADPVIVAEHYMSDGWKSGI